MGRFKLAIFFSILLGSLAAGEAFAAVSFSTLDRNDDDVISRSEYRWTTLSFRKKDTNHDGVLTRTEYERKYYSNGQRGDDGYAARSNYPTAFPSYNQGYTNPGYAYYPPTNVIPAYANNPGYGYYPAANTIPAYGYNQGLNPGYGSGYGVNPLGMLGGLGGMGGLGGFNQTPYVSESAAKTGAAINLAGSLISSIMAFR